MHPNEELLHRFYDAFARRDADAMAACYAKDCRFSDPVFPDLRGRDVMLMWRMLATSAKDLSIKVEGVVADADAGTARWAADYTFSRTGRSVHNEVESHVELRDGLIVRHVDSFPFWRWSRQALGPAGWLLGGTAWLKGRVRRDAAARLMAFKMEGKAAQAKAARRRAVARKRQGQ